MKLAYDTETALIRPGLAAPPLACTSWANEQLESGLWHATESREPWRKALADADSLLGLNMAYDTGVCAAQFPDLFGPICEAYLDERIHDVGIDQRLIDIANGELDGRWEDNPAYNPELPKKGKNKPQRWCKNKYALAELAARLWGEFMRKGADTWRMRYGTLIHVPLVCTRPGCRHDGSTLCQWPADAKHYAIHDSITTMKVHLHQLSRQTLPEGYPIEAGLVDSGKKAAAAFALHLQSCRGIRTDGERCKALVHAAEAEIERCRELCSRTLFDGKTLTAVEREAWDSNDAPSLLVPKLKGRKPHKYRAGWSKNLEHTRHYMLGAILRSSGLPDAPDWRDWLLRSVAEFVDNVEELPKDRFVHLEHELEDGITEIKVKLTKSGDIALDAEACKETQDPVLRAYATFTSATTLRNKARRMTLGAVVPLQTKYKLPMDTGRTSSSKSDKPLIGDNFQNFRRNAMTNELGDELPGQRECIKARDGYVLCSIDYDNAEMRSEAQIAIWEVGYSNLADVLNRGESAHLALAAAHLLNRPLTYEEAFALKKAGDKVVKNAIQFAKVPNFALLGGARALTMIPYAKGMNITLTEERALKLYDAFHNSWTEIAPMHDVVKKKLRAAKKSGAGGYVFESYVSKRLRWIDRYTVGCNNPFQSLTADAALSVQLWLALECYTGKEYTICSDGYRIRATGKCSPLEGSYVVLFCHDEDIFELRIWKYTHEAAHRAATIMKTGYDRYTPDVPMTCAPALMTHLYKQAEPVYGEDGRIRLWVPEVKKAA